jgi:hypothetical protein
MGLGDRRKCKCWLKLFRPDPRNRHHQRYCSVPACRAASKAASQARWLAKPGEPRLLPRSGERHPHARPPPTECTRAPVRKRSTEFISPLFSIGS